MRLLAFTLLLAAADTGDTGAHDAPDVGGFLALHGSDSDDDAWPDSVDCQPTDPRIYPGAPEICNGLDDDCDGAVDDIEELCDGVDNDCDGLIDEAEACRLCGGEPAVYRESAGLLSLPLLWSLRRRKRRGPRSAKLRT